MGNKLHGWYGLNQTNCMLLLGMLTGVILHKVKQPPKISATLNIGEHNVMIISY